MLLLKGWGIALRAISILKPILLIWVSFMKHKDILVYEMVNTDLLPFRMLNHHIWFLCCPEKAFLSWGKFLMNLKYLRFFQPKGTFCTPTHAHRKAYWAGLFGSPQLSGVVGMPNKPSLPSCWLINQWQRPALKTPGLKSARSLSHHLTADLKSLFEAYVLWCVTKHQINL